MATSRIDGGPAARYQLMTRAATVGLLMRNTVNLGVALIALADPATHLPPPGTALLAVLAAWSLVRLVTRSHHAWWLAADYVLVLAVCLAIPLLVSDADFYTANTAPQAIAGTAVISFSVSVPVKASIPMALGVAAAYACGAAGVIGWVGLAPVTALYYFAVQCATASVIRFMLLGVAGAIDDVRAEREEAEVAREVRDAVRDYEHEQLALLHDTAASTLLMVGQGTSLPAHRLAAQARRDLHLLGTGSWVAPPPRVDLVAALRDCASHLSTPVQFDGLEQHWLPGETAQPVVAAAREAMTNVDRHAHATRLRITVSENAVRLTDDGVGFDARTPRRGHGIDESIVGRMRRADGTARIESAAGSGTTTELSWSPQPAATERIGDPDRLVDRARTRYGLALAVYALVNLAVTVPAAQAAGTRASVDIALGAVAAVSALAAVPGILWRRWTYAWPAAFAVLAVAIAQPALLPDGTLLSYSHWAQGAIGWCILPLLLAVPTRAGVGILVAYWAANSVVVLVRDPSAAVLVNIGLGSASILGVQLFALVFNGLMREAADVVATETRTRQRLLARDRISQALRAEYQRRYVAIVGNVVPLLDALTRGERVDTAMQLKARAESRRLRALFDQVSIFDHPLMQAIRPLVDDAEARDVDVVIDVSGTLPDLDTHRTEALVTPLADVLGRAVTSARVVLTAEDGELGISAVVDTDPDDPPLPEADNVEVVVSGAQMWCLIRDTRSAVSVGQ